MDTSIRKLLIKAANFAAGDKNPALLQAFKLLQNVAETRPVIDTPESCGQDLYVLCAEFAYQHGYTDVARECIRMFFMKRPPANQFLCRAYLCQAQLLAPKTTNSPEELEKAAAYILKAILFAKEVERYHFLVYNASVIYWQLCQPFLKPGYRQYLTYSLHQVQKALDDVNDSDHAWRAQIMIALIECYLDAHHHRDASDVASAAAPFIKANVPSLYKTIFGIMVQHNLLETAKLHKEIQSSPELKLFYKICKLKNFRDKKGVRNISQDIQSILTQMGVYHKKKSMEKVDDAMSDQNTVSGQVSRDEQELDKNERPLLLLEVCHLCLELDLQELAITCKEAMKQCDVKDGGFHLELEFIECELMMHGLGAKQETYEKSVVDIRLQAIKRCDEALRNAVRLGDPKVIQVGCVTQWNLCLPLLQPNLRHFVHKPLVLVAEALENIESHLVQLRCEVHLELAHCYEDKEQVQVAMDNLRKALSLDVGNMYHERLEVLLHRLELRSQLYVKPERPEDQAAMTIEQARKVDSGTIRMKRSLLVKAGETLAPDAFLVVLDSENDTKEHSDGKESFTKKLAGKALHFRNCVSKAEEHLKRFNDGNDRERARLWGDLAKTARKQNVWDVCRVACRFCLLYDDGRWRTVQRKQSVSPQQIKSKPSTFREKDEEVDERKSISISEGPSSASQTTSVVDRDLNRLMAEVSFINGEALIQLLKSENVQLNDKPVLPEDKKNFRKGQDVKKLEEDYDWIYYCTWIKDLSEQASYSFLHGMALGIELEEAWIVVNAATYIWNYNNHILSQGRHAEIVPHLITILEGLKKCEPIGETVLLLNICNALAQGLIRPWIPDMKELVKPTKEIVSPKILKGKVTKVPAVLSKTKISATNDSPEAMLDLKKAIDICEFAMQVSSGDGTKPVVPIFHRLPILQTWVQAKQLTQQQISKQLGIDNESNNETQWQMTKPIIALEMISRSRNGIMEFKEAPTIEDVVIMVESIKWTDKLVELQIWTQLTYLAFEEHLHALVMRCSRNALRFAALGTQPRNRKMDLLRYTVEQEMLGYTSVLQGQSLMENMQGKNSLRREALEFFLNSAKYARSAANYELVMTAARHFWNACVPLVGQPIERELLRESIKIILECIAATTSKAKKEQKPIAEVQSEEQCGAEEQSKTVKETRKSSKEDREPKQGEKKMEGGKVQIRTTEKLEDDLLLRAAMYGVLFQSYADKGKWAEALEAIDKAITEMPRTSHRLLIFKHKVMVKAKLGQPIHMDIQKFKDESEDTFAQMWHRVALSSKEATEQLASYQCAIEALESEASCYQKVDYLLEFAQWLYTNQFSLEDAQNQLEWAIDILLNIKAPDSQAVKHQKGKKGRASNIGGNISEKGVKKVDQRDSLRSIGNSSVATIVDPTRGVSSPKAVARKKSQLKDSYSVSSDTNTEISTECFIPVIKAAEIGVLPSNPELTVSDLVSVRQLDALIMSHILLAEISGMESDEYRDTLLMAHQFLMRLWKVLINACASSIRNILKARLTLNVKEDVGKNTKSGPAGGKKDDKMKKEEKPKVKRKCPSDVIPSDLETWATYDWPDEGFEVFKMDNLRHVAISQSNIPKPMLTFYYLDRLITQLRDIGYNHLTLPVLAFQDLLSRSVLKNNALYNLVHLRSLEVCQELNIKSGISHHHKIIGPMRLNIEDQAKSRTEIFQWQEKQIQVAHEEQKVRKSESSAVESISRSMVPQTKPIQKSTQELKTESPEMDVHLTNVLGCVCLREVWTDTAEILIRQGFYQRAREFLIEANIAAEAFDDWILQARIMLLFASLAYYEAQYGLAINLCLKVQKLKQGDEKLWIETCILHAKAIMKDKGDTGSLGKAKKLLETVTKEFTKAGHEYPNRRIVTRFYCAKLEAELVKIHFKRIQQRNKDTNNKQDHQAILKGIECYEHISEQLMHFHCYRDAVHVARKHGRILRMLAMESTERELRWMYYSQALNVFKQAALIAEQVYTDVHTLSSLSEMKGLSTPVQRELADINIELGEILSDVLVCQEKEQRNKQLQEERKASIIHLVQEYIWEPPVYEGKEKLWIELGRIAADEAIGYFMCAYSMSGGIPHLRARSLAGLGRLLRVVSEYHNPDPPSRWMVHDIEALRILLAEEDALSEATALKTEAMNQEQDEEIPEDMIAPLQVEVLEVDKQDEGSTHTLVNEDEKDLKKIARYEQQMIVKKNQHETSKFYYMCASECLSQSLNISLQHHFTDIAAKASLEMVTLIGQHDPSTASMMLALYQSCESSLIMEQVLFKSQSDPLTSQLAALLHQRHHLLKNDIQTNHATSPFLKDITDTLSRDWQAWRKLEVTSNHLDLLKEIPSNYILIILQHSPDKNFLYGAILDKPKGSSVKPPKLNDKNVSRSKIFGASTDFSQLKHILSTLHIYKQKQQSMLLKREYRRSNAAAREKMLKNLEMDFKDADKSHLEDRNEDAKLEKEFLEIVEMMNTYLRPVLEPICNSLRGDTASSLMVTESKEKEKGSKEHLAKSECVVLLADPDLMHMPLEASLYLQLIDGANSISRDFSLQFLYNRTHNNKPDTDQGKVEVKSDGKKKGTKETSKTISRIPDLRDSKQKQTKIIPLDRHLLPWQVPVNTHFFKYIVNPFLDCSDNEASEPIKEFEKILEKYEQQFTPKWQGVLGSEHTPSIGEWEIYLAESNAFIFYGTQKLLAHIPPHKMSALNLPDCSILLCFDHAETSKSIERQSKVDALKSPLALSLESPIEMAMLTSLSGIRCIFLNQWHCSLAENADKIHQTMAFLLQKGKTTGQTSYMLHNPQIAYVEEKLAQSMLEKGKDQEAQKDKKRNKDEEASTKVKTKKSKGLLPEVENEDKQEDVTKQQEEIAKENSKLEEISPVFRSVFNMVCFGMPNLVVMQEHLSSQSQSEKVKK